MFLLVAVRKAEGEMGMEKGRQIGKLLYSSNSVLVQLEAHVPTLPLDLPTVSP